MTSSRTALRHETADALDGMTIGGVAVAVVRQRVVPSEVSEFPLVSVYIPDEPFGDPRGRTPGQRIEVSNPRVVVAVLQARPTAENGNLEDLVDEAIAQVRDRIAARLRGSFGNGSRPAASDMRIKRIQTAMSTGSANAVVVTVLDYEAELHTVEGQSTNALPRRGDQA